MKYGFTIHRRPNRVILSSCHRIGIFHSSVKFNNILERIRSLQAREFTVRSVPGGIALCPNIQTPDDRRHSPPLIRAAMAEI
jgi:hypothetical protein